MNRKLNPLIAFAAALLLLVGTGMTCQNKSPRKITYDTLASVGYTTDAALKSYLDLVARGQLSASGLPEVTKTYNSFQAIYNLAVSVALFNTNAVATTDVVTESINVINAIERAKVRQ